VKRNAEPKHKIIPTPTFILLSRVDDRMTAKSQKHSGIQNKLKPAKYKPSWRPT